LGIGDWGLGIGPNPHPQSPIPNYLFFLLICKKFFKKIYYGKLNKINKK